MECHRVYFILFAMSSLCICIVVSFECDMNAEVCETSLVVDNQLTMTSLTSGGNVCAKGGKLYSNCDDRNEEIPMSEVITADGWEEKKVVVVANLSLSNNPIIVYKDQRLIIKVINNLYSDTVTIHWHGLLQENTPWMDGVGLITQCPILQGQSFTYDFIANPAGTYWYHSHVGMQRVMGLNGPLIIRERHEDTIEEHIMTVQGWNHDWGADHDFLAHFNLTSVLINGRGRYYTNTSTNDHNEAPLETFSVEQGKQYRFRVINVGSGHTFRVSVDNHDIKLIASDGRDFIPVDAESFIFSPGERFDFILTANQSVDNYWIRAVTIGPNNFRIGEAILRYKNAPLVEPVTSRKDCTLSSKCFVVNCPFSYFPEKDYITCNRFADMRRQGNDPAPSPNGTDSVFKEYFLNFGFPGRNSTPASVNGIQFVLPSVSALTQPQEIDVTCENAGCGENKLCKCMHSISINENEIVQLVLLNMGIGRRGAHPIHLHGYSYYVVKMGYATYNNVTGEFISQNEDINCRGVGGPNQSFCNKATWSDPSWLGGNVPGMELQHAPRKDTLLIPSGSYAVIRIKAGNWGVWLMHCHIATHFQDGMGLVLNDSFALQSKSSPPIGFPQCRSFPSAYETRKDGEMEAMEDTDQASENDVYKVAFWVMLPVMMVLLLLTVAYIVYLRKQNLTIIQGSAAGTEMTARS
ncbi:laccase-like [Pecten maximus]|uniref:laccase-like n=1 Tax=Pecten maximus TaxID=6579 RepID=UPI001458B8F7|nr:laccase-like [Pecten maximus]